MPEAMFQEEPLDRFRQRGLRYAPRMRYDPSMVNEAVATLVNALGEEWVLAKAESTLRGVPVPFREHPIGGLVHTAGEVQIAEALELARYLRLVASSPAFPIVIAGLKAQYRPTLLQLAFAYRIGCITGETPKLEPAVEDGRRADIEFTLGEQPYVVECYAPGKRSHKLDEVHWLASKAMQRVKDRTATFSVAIQLLRLPDAQERKELEHRIHQAAVDLEARTWDGTGWPPSELVDTDVARISIARTLVSKPGQPANLVLHPEFPDLGEPDQFIAAKHVPASDIGRLDFHTLPVPYEDHVAVWTPEGHYGLPGAVDDQVLDLLPKLKDKLSQTRLEGRQRILVVDTWTALDRYELAPSTKQRLSDVLFHQHRDVAGVLMVTRRFRETVQRHRYDIRPLPNPNLNGEPIMKLTEQESEMLVPPIASV